jgi:hypothetical protein
MRSGSYASSQSRLRSLRRTAFLLSASHWDDARSRVPGPDDLPRSPESMDRETGDLFAPTDRISRD